MGVKGLVVSEREQSLVPGPASIPASTTCDGFVRILFIHRPALGFPPSESVSRVQVFCSWEGFRAQYNSQQCRLARPCHFKAR